MDMFGFGPMGSFFFDEFLFNEEDERRQRDDEGCVCRELCPDCGADRIN